MFKTTHLKAVSMHRLIRRYTVCILIFGCLVCVAVLILVLTHQYHGILNEIRQKVTTIIGESEVKKKTKKPGMSIEAVPGSVKL